MEGLTVDGVLIAVAAISAAAIAASTANHRMERQLAEERERLRSQLLHDQRMRDREELRRTLDEAASAVADAAEELHFALAAAARRSKGPEAEKTFADLRRGLRDKVYAAFIQSERLKFRFAEGDEIPKEFERAYTRLHDASKLLGDPGDDDLEKGDGLLDEAVSGYLEFARLCRPYVEVGAPEPGD